MIFNEQELKRLTLCPLMTPASPSHAEVCAYTLASWTLRRSLEGEFKGSANDILHEIRGQVIKEWKKGSKEDPGLVSRTIGFRLFNLILDYEVLHLEQPYNLILAGYTIQGKYALLRKRRGASLPFMLALHTFEPKLKHDQILPPDVITVARYVHVVTCTKYKDVQVLHYPIIRGQMWTNKTIGIPLAQQYLEGILKVAALNPKYPSSGAHCESCVTKPCLEIFRG